MYFSCFWWKLKISTVEKAVNRKIFFHMDEILNACHSAVRSLQRLGVNWLKLPWACFSSATVDMLSKVFFCKPVTFYVVQKRVPKKLYSGFLIILSLGTLKKTPVENFSVPDGAYYFLTSFMLSFGQSLEYVFIKVRFSTSVWDTLISSAIQFNYYIWSYN